jgi:S1-C subfamily serine protease
MTREIARYYGLPADHGVLVTKVTDSSPAKDADLIEGDIILKIDNVELHRIEDLVAEIHKRKVGESVRIFALRNGRERFFILKLREAP